MDKQKILEELHTISSEVQEHIVQYRLYLAIEKLYHYTWHQFADFVIEDSKPILQGKDEMARLSRQQTLFASLLTILRLLHPFAPFVTEEIYQQLPSKTADWQKKQTLMVETWPA